MLTVTGFHLVNFMLYTREQDEDNLLARFEISDDILEKDIHVYSDFKVVREHKVQQPALGCGDDCEWGRWSTVQS